MKRVVLLLAMASLTTCPAAQTNSQAWGAQNKIIESEYRQALAQDPALESIRNKMSLTNASAQTFEMLVDTTTPNTEQQRAIQKYAQIRDHYTARFAENDARFGNPLRHANQRAVTAVRSLLAELHNGQLTFGEFAKRRQTISDNVGQEQLRASQSAEAAQRDQEARNREAARLDQEAARLDKEAADRRNQALLETGAALLQTPNSGSAGAVGAVGFFKRDYVSGSNRICLYDRLGSAVAVTISVTAPCPLNIP